MALVVKRVGEVKGLVRKSPLYWESIEFFAKDLVARAIFYALPDECKLHYLKRNISASNMEEKEPVYGRIYLWMMMMLGKIVFYFYFKVHCLFCYVCVWCCGLCSIFQCLFCFAWIFMLCGLNLASVFSIVWEFWIMFLFFQYCDIIYGSEVDTNEYYTYDDSYHHHQHFPMFSVAHKEKKLEN